MATRPLSKNQQDNEKRKFKADLNGDTAVNICGEQLDQITDAINGIDTNIDTITTYNILITTANTEFSHTFTSNTKAFSMKVREDSDLQFSYITGTTNTNFNTLPACLAYEENDLDLTGVTIYFESPDSGITVEIIEKT